MQETSKSVIFYIKIYLIYKIIHNLFIYTIIVVFALIHQTKKYSLNRNIINLSFLILF